MIDFTRSKLFIPWIDPASGVTLYLLAQKAAPVQQGFYFVNDGTSSDGRYLWFYCAFPPSEAKTLGVVDFEKQQVFHFPETQFSAVSPFVDGATGWACWCSHNAIWRRGPDPACTAELVNALPEEVIQNRPISRLATHLTRSANGKEFFVDAGVGLKWIFGTLPADGGDFQLWHEFERHHDHAQFSPADPDLILLAQENHIDPATGLLSPITDRLWKLRRGGNPEPVHPRPTVVTHEWWDEGGDHAWCVDCPESVRRVRLADGAVEQVWANKGAWHGHHSPCGKYVLLDRPADVARLYRGCESTVDFLNRETGRQIRIVTNPEVRGIVGARYHIDPHPRFCRGGFIVFTVTVRGGVDLALVRTGDLIERTS